jgi:ElaB/YqjD/DUF883 family membrane-anchored ribosome-binding protein
MSREIDELEQEIAETRADLDHALDLLQAKMTPSALINQAFDHAHRNPYVSASMGQMYAHRPFTAVLMTAGLNWYLGKRAAKRERESDREWQAYHDDRPRHRVRELASRARARVKTSAERARERISEAVHRVEDGATHAMEGAQHAAEAAKERMHTAADGAREHLADAKGRGTRRMHDMMENGRERSHHMAESTRERMRNNKQRARSFVEKQPLLAGAICAVLGAVIASAIPATGAERRAARPLAKQAKRLKAQAKEKAVHGIERGATMATEALETATTNIEKRILPEAPSVH